MNSVVYLWGGPPCASHFLLFTTLSLASCIQILSLTVYLLLDSVVMPGYCFCWENILSTVSFFIKYFPWMQLEKNCALHPSLVLIYSVKATVLMLCAVPMVPVFTHSSLRSEILSRQRNTGSTLKCLISIKRYNLSSRMCSMHKMTPIDPAPVSRGGRGWECMALITAMAVLAHYVVADSHAEDCSTIKGYK